MAWALRTAAVSAAASSAPASRLATPAPGTGARSSAGRGGRAGQLGEARLGAGEQAAEAGEPGLGLGDVGIDPGEVAFGRDALADADLDRGAQVALAGGEGLGQRDQGAEGEDVVPGGDRVERDPVGGDFELGAGGAQPRAGGEDALRWSAPKSNRVWLTASDGVGALRGPRALDDVVRIVGEFAREHPVGGDAEVDRRQPALARLLEHAERLVLAGRRLGGAGMALDRGGDRGAERLERGLLAAQAEDRIGGEVDGERPAGRRRQRRPGRARARPPPDRPRPPPIALTSRTVPLSRSERGDVGCGVPQFQLVADRVPRSFCSEVRSFASRSSRPCAALPGGAAARSAARG